MQALQEHGRRACLMNTRRYYVEIETN